MGINPITARLAGGLSVPATGAISGRPLPGNPQQLPIAPGQPPSRRWAKLADGRQTVVIFDPHRYAKFNGEQSFGLTANLSQLISDVPNTYRNALVIRNGSAGTEVVYISLGGPASTRSLLRLAVGDQVAFTDVVPQDQVYAFSTDAAAIVIIGTSQTPETLE